MMKVYFSHPSFTFQTKTERMCIKIIEENMAADKIINPSTFGLRENPIKKIKEADVDIVIGMAVSNKLIYSVWKEMKIGRANGSDLCTFYVENKGDIGPLVEGVPESVEKLSKRDSKKFSNEIIEGYKESFYSLIFGNIGRRF